MKLTGAKVTSWPASQERENEDSAIIDPQGAVVVDGAGIPTSMRSGCSHSVAWYSQTLATRLQLRLANRDAAMRDALRSAIADVGAEHSDSCDLAAGSPSATVAAWRLTGATLEYLVLCDSSILLAFADGRDLEVTDTRLDEVVEPWVEKAMAQRTRSGATNLPQDILAARRAAVEALRNTKEGFWCCHHDPSAADEAVEGSVPLAVLRGVVLATDGATRGIHLLNIHTRKDVMDMVLPGLHGKLLGQIRTAEEQDKQTLALRSVKVHDDATLISARFQ